MRRDSARRSSSADATGANTTRWVRRPSRDAAAAPVEVDVVVEQDRQRAERGAEPEVGGLGRRADRGIGRAQPEDVLAGEEDRRR